MTIVVSGLWYLLGVFVMARAGLGYGDPKTEVIFGVLAFLMSEVLHIKANLKARAHGRR